MLGVSLAHSCHSMGEEVTVIFQDDLSTVIHGKWQDNLPWIDMADVLITDPPYGMDYISNFALDGPSPPVRGDRDTVERDTLLASWFRQGQAVGRDDRPAIVFGTWRVERPKFGIRQLLVWHKGDTPGMGDLSIPWGPSHEEAYVMGGYRKTDWTGKRGPSVIRARVTEGTAKGERQRNGHPTPKPVLLMQSLIAHTTGALIIDPFMGSGSTLVAARLLGRPCIGIEMDRQYADSAVERIKRIKR